MEPLHQKTVQLAAVREISRAIAEARDLKSTLDLIVQRTTEVMQVASCSIYLYDKEDQKLILAATTGLNQQGIGHIALTPGSGLTGWAAAYGETVAIANADTDPRFYRVVGSGESRFVSLMAMPLITRGKVIGAANVQTANYHPFSEDEIEIFSFITDLAATALEKAKLVHAEVLQEIHHRVKNNLQTIAMLLRLQMSQADELSPRNILHETINRVLSIAAVHEILAQDHHSHIGLKRLLKHVSQMIAHNMTIDGRVIVTVKGDDFLVPSQIATNLALVTNELLQNALEHGLAHCDQGEVKIRLSIDDNHFTLTVSDHGRGLSDSFNLPEDQGLGLELVQTTIVEDLEGTFTLTATPQGSTLATVRIPLDKITEEVIYSDD